MDYFPCSKELDSISIPYPIFMTSAARLAFCLAFAISVKEINPPHYEKLLLSLGLEL